MSQPTGAQLLVDCLVAEGAKYAFCIPGAKVDKVVDCLAGSPIQTVVCRHEQNAALIAQGIGRMTGKAGVCVVTSGPGCTNLATGLITARDEGDPVVALGGAVTLADRLKSAHQSFDTVNFFKPITKYAAEITSPHGITEVMATAFRTAEGGRPGSSFVALPRDVMEGPAALTCPGAAPRPHFGIVDPNTAAAAAELINKAKCPVLCLGMLASEPKTAEAIRRLLRKTPLPVVCTFQGAGVIARDLLSCFAGRIGLSHNQPGDRLLDAADLVVAIGFNPIEYDPIAWNKGTIRPLIHIDRVPAEMDADYWPTIEMVGDLPAAIDSLAVHLKPTAKLAEIEPLQAAARELAQTKAHGADLSGSPVHPLRLIYDLQEFVTEDTTVLCDIGSIYMWVSRYLFSYRPRQLLTSNGQQTLGVALPWAIAACLVRPGERVLSMSGDGGFLFSAQELETAVRLKCNFVHLIWDDQSFNMVKIQQIPKYGREAAVALGYVDFVKYAEAFGATGLRIDSPGQIVPTLKKAFATPGPVIVHIPIDYSNNASLFQSMKTEAIH